MPAPQPQQQTNNLIWVQGIEGAKALMLPPNAKIICLDSEIENRTYIKIADAKEIEKIICDVHSEIQDIEHYQICNAATNYDMVRIMEEQ